MARSYTVDSKGNRIYTMVSGDTLSAIGRDFGVSVKNLASWNNIKNVNLIYPKQKFIVGHEPGGSVKKESTSSKKTSSSNSASNKVKIDHFGIQSGTERTVFATWTFGRDHVEEYKILWKYYTGDGVGFIGQEGTTKAKQSLYNAPNNATRVTFKVKPVAKKHKVNNKDVEYWTGEWCTAKEIKMKDIINPKTPPVPTVDINKLKLTAFIDNLDVDAEEVEFQVVKNNEKVVKTSKGKPTKKDKIDKNYVSVSYSVEAGNEYKVRARSIMKKVCSDWSNYSSNVSSMPAAPSKLEDGSPTARSATEVYLNWNGIAGATGYEIEYTQHKRYFDSSPDNVQTHTVDGNVSHAEITGLSSGKWYFRIRAKKDGEVSSWFSTIKTKAGEEDITIIMGEKPGVPTTWSNSSTLITGEDLTLYWIHNSQDNSSETYAEIELTINGVKQTITRKKSTSEEEKDKTSYYVIHTNQYIEGTKILWRVRTKGVINEYSDWSIQRTVDIFAPPTLELNLRNKQDSDISTVEEFPFYIKAVPGPATQAPLGYHVQVISNDTYTTTDRVGNSITISEGQEIYSQYFDTNQALLLGMLPNSIDLENNITYTIICTVAMNSGLSVSESIEFNVAWEDVEYSPSAEILIDSDTLAAHIRPFCENVPTVHKVVNLVNGIYRKTDTITEVGWDNNDLNNGDLIDNAYLDDPQEIIDPETGDVIGFDKELIEVYIKDGVMYCEEDGEKVLVDNVTLSVYRKEFDGTFTEIQTNISNTKNEFVADPHPSLDYARYRIVAQTNDTGAISYSDVMMPVNEKGIIIQWDEEWSNFETTEESELERPPWSGSMLKLPYNIDVSDSNSKDVEMIEYAGREHPVSYYGTQIGQKADWKVDIDIEDKETLYALRRLSRWMGDVYVREPSGSGYWANISVSFSQTHLSVIIPVSLSITRVEGGI